MSSFFHSKNYKRLLHVQCTMLEQHNSSFRSTFLTCWIPIFCVVLHHVFCSRFNSQLARRVLFTRADLVDDEPGLRGCLPFSLPLTAPPAPSRKGCVINGQMTKASTKWVPFPPPPPPIHAFCVFILKQERTYHSHNRRRDVKWLKVSGFSVDRPQISSAPAVGFSY